MKAQFTLIIRALPDRVPAEQRLRSILKKLLRHHSFVCIKCTPLSEITESKECNNTGIEQLRRLKEELAADLKGKP